LTNKIFINISKESSAHGNFLQGKDFSKICENDIIFVELFIQLWYKLKFMKKHLEPFKIYIFHISQSFRPFIHG
jgi:hypothetical protein